MGFDDAERSEATQVLDLAEEDYKEDGLVPLRYVKFQNVQSVTVRRYRPTEKYPEIPWKTHFTNLIMFTITPFICEISQV